MEIEISPHTLQRANERGTNEDEIKEVILNGEVLPSKSDRLAKEKIFSFNKIWNQQFYNEKLVRVFYVVANVIHTVTVIVQFGKFSKN